MAPDNRTYTRSEVNRILRKAAEIQAEGGEADAENGLTETELLQVAREAGIDQDTMLRALREYDLPAEEDRFEWLKGTTSLQKKAELPGEITEEQWEEVVRDIRDITGGIGKTHVGSRSFEWEQRKRDTGYIHLSATPRKGKTILQFVSDWNSHRRSVSIISFVVFFTGGALFMDTLPIPDFLQIFASAAVGLGGIGVGRFFLRSFYKTQKERMQQILKAFARRLHPAVEGVPRREERRLNLEEDTRTSEPDRESASAGPSRLKS